MTYCLALRLDEGLVFLSDTRTNAGVDNVGTYRKLHVLRPGADRAVRAPVGRHPGHHPGGARPDRRPTSPRPATTRAWPRSSHLFEAALYLGRLSRRGQPAGTRPPSASSAHGHVHPRRPDRRRAPGHPARLPRGQLHPGVRRAPVPADRREQVRQVHARAGGARPGRHRDGDQDRAELDDQHRPRQPVGRPALRPRRLPQRLAGASRRCGSRPTRRTSPRSERSGWSTSSTRSTGCHRSRPAEPPGPTRRCPAGLRRVRCGPCRRGRRSRRRNRSSPGGCGGCSTPVATRRSPRCAPTARHASRASSASSPTASCASVR